jgi:hypothetical protein
LGVATESLPKSGFAAAVKFFLIPEKSTWSN